MKKKPELRQLRQLRITEAIFLKKNLNYVNYVITPITQLQKRQNHPLVLPLVPPTYQCPPPIHQLRKKLVPPNQLCKFVILQKKGLYIFPFQDHSQLGYHQQASEE